MLKETDASRAVHATASSTTNGIMTVFILSIELTGESVGVTGVLVEMTGVLVEISGVLVEVIAGDEETWLVACVGENSYW